MAKFDFFKRVNRGRISLWSGSISVLIFIYFLVSVSGALTTSILGLLFGLNGVWLASKQLKKVKSKVAKYGLWISSAGIILNIITFLLFLIFS